MKKLGIKWLLILILVFILSFTFVACNKKSDSAGPELPQDEPEQEEEAIVYKDPVFAIVSNDEQDPYEKSIINAAKLACLANNVPVTSTIATTETAVDVITTLKNNEANVIIATDANLEQNFVDAARLLPDIQFITLGGTKANSLRLKNYHNAYASTYEGRYLNGIVAGLKLNQLIADNTISEDGARIGFIATDAVQEQISEYTAFYLGAKSVCPTVKMSVKFAKTNEEKEDATSLLITIGCKVISQYSYKDDIVSKACSENETPIANVTYLTNNSTKYSNSFLTGFNINWTPYFTYLISTIKNQQAIASDWAGTLSNGGIELLDVNTSIVDSTVSSTVETASNKIKNNELQIFDTSSFTVDKCPVTSYVPAINTTRNAYISNETKAYIIDGNASLFRSVPYFGLLIDGIYYDSNITMRHIGQFTIDESQRPAEDENLTPAEKYFKALFSGAKAIDSPEINPATDKVEYTISGYVEYKSDIANSITRAYEINLILDLAAINATIPTLGDSAIRIRLFNKNTNENYFSALYFTKDTPNTIFLEYKGQYFKFGLGSSFDISDIIDFINENTQQSPDDSANSSIIDTITDGMTDFAQTGDVGEFSLDSITVKSILDLAGINIVELLADPMISTALGMIGINAADLETMTIKDLLMKFGSYIIDEDQIVIKENVDGSITYESKDLSPELKKIVNTLANKIIEKVSFGLSFTISENDTFKDMTFDFYSTYTDYQHFDVRIHVNEITVEIITDNAKDLIGNTHEYKDYLEIQFTASLDLKNKVSIYVDDTPVALGKFDLNAYLALDFINEGDENKTAIEIKLKSDNEQILRIVVNDGTLGIDVDMSNLQMQAIINAFLKDFCSLIKKYAVGDNANVAFKLIGDAADELLSKVFNPDDSINTSFSNITINNIDLFALSRGLVYGIFDKLMIFVNNELPREEKTPETIVSLPVFEEEDGSLLSYNVQFSTNNFLKLISNAISYNATDSIISISFSDIKGTLANLYSAGRDKPSSTSDIMSYLIGTDDSIINSLTAHGLWPLYNGSLNTQKYITADYTIAQAIADGYCSMPGSVVSKTNAENIWSFISKQTNVLNYRYVLVNRTGSYVSVNGDYATLEEYLDSFTVNRYFNLFKASTILNGATNVHTALNSIFSATNSLTIQIAETEDMINITLVMLGDTFTLNADFDILGVDLADIDVPDFTDTSAIASENKVILTLDEDFYTLFNAVYGFGYGTKMTEGTWTNNSLYYIATSATYDKEEEKYSAIELSGSTIIILDEDDYLLVTTSGCTNGTYSIDEETGIFTSVTLNDSVDGTTYNILGSRYKVLLEA